MKAQASFFLAGAAALLLAGCASRTGTTGEYGGEATAHAYPVPEGEAVLLDDFEGENRWQAESWEPYGAHNLAQTTEVSIAWASQGESAARWTFEAATAESSKPATFTCDLDESEQDWTDVTALVCDVNNVSGQELLMSASVQDGTEWQWSVSPDVRITEGVTLNATFDMLHVADGAGQPRPDGIWNAGGIFKGRMQIAGASTGGTIYVDNIRLIRRPSAPE